MLKNGTWDVRCPPELKAMFPRENRRGYWYKVNLEQMKTITVFLSKAYGISPPTVRLFRKGENIREGFIERGFASNRLRGCYWPRDRTICVYARNHIKTIFHEFYHHLDEMTDGRYNSSDRKNHGWIFGDLMWEAFRAP